MAGLSVSDLVSVQVSLSPTAAATRSFGTLLLLGASPVIDTFQRIRQYSTLISVANDFGTSAPEYLAASLFFAQSPQPSSLYVGRWAQSASSGVLHGATLTVAQQALTNFTAITNGSASITVDGTTRALTGLSFAAATNLNGVASVLQTALAGAATVVWNAVYGRFDVTSGTTGIASSVAFATAGSGGTDISNLLGLRSTSGGTSVAGIAPESMLAAVQALAAASGNWYGLVIAYPTPASADIVAVAGYIEASNPQRFFGVTTQDVNAIDPTQNGDIASQLQALGYNHTFVQYSSSSPYAAASLFARQATVDFTANNSTITLMYKTEPGIAAETLTETQATTLKGKNCNVFVAYNNATAIIQWGVCASGQYIDTIVGVDWLQNNVQTAVFNLLYTSTTKVPQTDAGVNQIVTTVEASLEAAVRDGLAGPGVWTGPAFGAIVSGQTLSKGYYVYAPPVASQSSADRAARKSPTIQCALKLGGAIHTANVMINVNQ